MAQPIPKKNSRKPFSRKLFLAISIFSITVTTLLLYHQSVKNDFLDLDDMTLIVKNYNFLSDFSNTGQAFKQGVFKVEGQEDTLVSYYRPMMTLSFMIDAHISPKKSRFPVPAPFLKANIFYHLVACILLFFLLLELNIPPLTSLLLTLIFTVHPLLNQAVGWIPGRNDPLLAIFTISSFLCLIRYIKTHKQTAFIFHIFFFLIALFTKENAIMFVVLVFLYLRIVNKKPVKRNKYLKLAIGYLVCIIPWFLMRHFALASNADRSTLLDISKTLFSNTPLFIQYLSKSILPFNLSVMTTTADTNYIVGALAIILLIAGILLSKKKIKSFMIFGFCWFVLFLVPSFFSSFSGLEHRAYLPLMGIIFLTSEFDIVKAAGFNTVSGKWGVALLCGILLVFFITSYKRLPIFENRFAFDESAMETSPHALVPCIYLATHYDENGMYEKAIDTYKEALKRDSTYSTTYLNMAGDYLRLNNYKEAENTLNLALHHNPANSMATFNLGLIVFQYEHKDSEGVALWKRSIALDSTFARPYKVLSQYYQAMGDSNNTVLYRNLYLKRKDIQ